MSYTNEKAPDAGPVYDGLQVQEDTVPKLDRQTLEALQAEEDAHLGVKAIEAAEKVYGRYSKWFLFLGLALASYSYSLDLTTTNNYLAFAASAFDKHSLISTIQVVQSVIIACIGPVIAKVADVTSRATAFVLILILYVLGYIVIASAQNVGALAVGIIFYAIGFTGFQLLLSIIVADITVLKWRGLFSSLISAPFIINAFVGSNIATQILERSGWRWGYGMFAILIPATLSPLLVTLFWAEQKAKRLGLVPRRGNPSDKSSIAKRVWSFAQQLDIVGLVLIGMSISLILLPLTLASRAKGQWRNPSMIAMLVVGCILLPAIAVWEIYVAKRPAIARRFLVNRTVILAAWISFFEFFSSTLTTIYLYSYVLITKDWSLVNVTYFNQAQSVALTVFGIIAGLSMRFLRRYKWVLIAGLSIRLLGVGLMIHSRGANGSAAEIVWTQILQGLGGGFSVVAASVAAQASVPHLDMAMATAVLFVWSEIGSAAGSAVAGAIWTSEMPVKLAEHLPDVDQATRDQLFGSITDVMAFPFGDPTREGVIAAYGDVMKLMLIAATVLSVVPLILAFFMPNWYLGDKQNAVDAMDLKGELAAPAQRESEMREENGSTAK